MPHIQYDVDDLYVNMGKRPRPSRMPMICALLAIAVTTMLVWVLL